MIFLHIKTREDEFESRYHDFQRAHKYIVKLDDQTKIETAVYEHFLKNYPTHISIDISTMAGCPMKCAFCASSSFKYRKFLCAEEIVAQTKFMISKFAISQYSKINCSFQGIGEPSLLPEQVISGGLSYLVNAWQKITQRYIQVVEVA